MAARLTQDASFTACGHDGRLGLVEIVTTSTKAMRDYAAPRRQTELGKVLVALLYGLAKCGQVENLIGDSLPV